VRKSGEIGMQRVEKYAVCRQIYEMEGRSNMVHCCQMGRLASSRLTSLNISVLLFCRSPI
jgi:hypothetical protein